MSRRGGKARALHAVTRVKRAGNSAPLLHRFDFIVVVKRYNGEKLRNFSFFPKGAAPEHSFPGCKTVERFPAPARLTPLDAKDISTANGLHADRAAGRDCDYRDSGGDVVAGRAQDEGQGAAHRRCE